MVDRMKRVRAFAFIFLPLGLDVMVLLYDVESSGGVRSVLCECEVTCLMNDGRLMAELHTYTGFLSRERHPPSASSPNSLEMAWPNPPSGPPSHHLVGQEARPQGTH